MICDDIMYMLTKTFFFFSGGRGAGICMNLPDDAWTIAMVFDDGGGVRMVVYIFFGGGWVVRMMSEATGIGILGWDWEQSFCNWGGS